MRRLCVPTLLLALTVAACDGDSPTNPTLPLGNVPFQRLLTAVVSALEDSSRQVVRTTAPFEQVWDDIQADLPMPEPLPLVDFNTDMVLVVAAGEQETDCHAIEVTSIVSDGIDVTVTVIETAPTDDCVCGDVVSSPVEVVRLPRADGVSFVEVAVEACDT